MAWRDDEEDWDDDDDYGEEKEDDEEPLVPCPYCRRQIYEDAQRCPYCEKYISQEDLPPQRKPWWIIVGILLCFLVFYSWIMWGF